MDRGRSSATAEVVVVGAGAFGAWTALSLVERGASVILIDAHGPGNAMGSSGGESRNIRAAYGERELYTRWSMRAWNLWLAREQDFGMRCLYASGSLRVLTAAEAARQSKVFDSAGHSYELLDSDGVRARWPQIDFRNESHILYEPKSGTILARDSLIAVVEHFARQGGRYLEARVSLLDRPGDRLKTLRAGDVAVSAGTFVFACGPWLPRLFPDLLGRHIKTPRRELFFLAPPEGDASYRWDCCPSLVDPLGWTSSDIGGGVKIAPVIRHVPMNPDEADRAPTPRLLDQVRAYCASRLPALADRPVVSTYVSQLENTDNEHFLIDRHPALADVLIAGGGSGHAFKMGPVIGEHVAGLALRDPLDPALHAVFGLAAHRPVASHEGG